VYKDVKIDGNLFVGGTIETEKLIIGGEETSRWLGVRTSHPLNAQEGDMYYNKTDKEVYVFVDGNWEIIVN
ncbi:MAG TPA: hypothetical protein PK957_04160, partial [Candidatus Dojkabacteria bacterium]|nr:hypothetical protein [Candidatus Dojkabacteria bacterium]